MPNVVGGDNAIGGEERGRGGGRGRGDVNGEVDGVLVPKVVGGRGDDDKSEPGGFGWVSDHAIKMGMDCLYD